MGPDGTAIAMVRMAVSIQITLIQKDFWMASLHG
jgi:hypothetical protein